MIELFNKTSEEISKLTTHRYSTSFTLGIKAFHKPVRKHIYAIYAWSRYADEIVDTFLDHSAEDRRSILETYEKATYDGIRAGVSPFPVIHSFQSTVNRFNIPMELIDAFFESMQMDLDVDSGVRSGSSYEEYIYGSAEVIGLMCLMVFVKGDVAEYERLKEPAQKLGAAFQKVNFLRDMKSDYEERGRIYFPDVDFKEFDESAKSRIEEEIARDFEAAYAGVMQLPRDCRKGVYLAYKYYLSLFGKIRRARPERIRVERMRLPNFIKLAILVKTMLRGMVRAY